jgi:branched-chain amino acid transport system permease protein
MEVLIQQLVNGFLMGSIYVLIALGMVIILNVLHVINFAHGQFAMIGAFLAFFLMSLYNVNFFLVLIAAFIVGGAISFVYERLVCRPSRLKKQPMLVAGIATVGVAIVLDEIACLLFGTDDRMLRVPFGGHPIVIGDIQFSLLRLLIPVLGLSLMALTMLFIYKTKTGASLRAIAQEPEAASLVGIDADKAMSLAFFLSCGLAAVAGAFFTQMIPIDAYMGLPLSLRAFAILTVGGLMSLPGAIATSYILGIGEALVSGYIGAAWKDIFFFGIMVLILLIRPKGLFGKRLVK